jgi:murein endopeptidase
MKNRFKTMGCALALTFMLLFGAAAFARTTNTSVVNPNMSSGGTLSAGNQREWIRRHRRHRRHRHMRRMAHRENRELGRKMRENR